MSRVDTKQPIVSRDLCRNQKKRNSVDISALFDSPRSPAPDAMTLFDRSSDDELSIEMFSHPQLDSAEADEEDYYRSVPNEPIEFSTKLQETEGHRSIRYNIMPHISQILIGALFLCIGIIGMHWYGMQSMMIENVRMTYNVSLVILSCIIAYIASAAALWLSFSWKEDWQQLVSAFIMAIAVCGMHYTGQLACNYHYDPSVTMPDSHVITSQQIPLFVVITTCMVCFLMVGIISSHSRNKRKLEMLLTNLNREMDISDKLLLNILPYTIASKMKSGERYIHEVYENVTVVFADLVSFTNLSREAPPQLIIFMLHELFSRFDDALEEYGLEKIKTIGDAYLCVAGLQNPQSNHAKLAVQFGSKMIEIVNQFNKEHIKGYNRSTSTSMTKSLSQPDLPTDTSVKPEIPSCLQLRVGCHSGSVVGGVVGVSRFAFDIFGATVNYASRLETTGVPGMIQVSEETYNQVRSHFHFEKRENILIKGIGVKTVYITDGQKP